MATQSNTFFPPYSTGNPGFARHETLLTVADFRKRFLHGVDLKDNQGNEMDDSVIENILFSAISLVEHELDLIITPTEFTELHDYFAGDYQQYGFIQLDRKPVLSVTTLQAQYIKNETTIEFPQAWIRLYPLLGQIHVTPTSGALTTFNLSNTGFLPRLFGVKTDYPQLWKVVFIAGFEQDKIPMLINRLVGLYAAIPLLTIAGELVLGAGIASTSISLDGLSQSISSTASAENNAYGARIKLHQEEVKQIKAAAYNYYKGINFMVC